MRDPLFLVVFMACFVPLAYLVGDAAEVARWSDAALAIAALLIIAFSAVVGYAASLLAD